jgi:Na+/H+-translocating membrane pyrophosphatase
MDIDELDAYDDKIESAKAKLTQIKCAYYASIVFIVAGIVVAFLFTTAEDRGDTIAGIVCSILLIVVPGLVGIYMTRFCVWTDYPHRHDFPPVKHFARKVAKAEKAKTNFLLNQGGEK